MAVAVGLGAALAGAGGWAAWFWAQPGELPPDLAAMRAFPNWKPEGIERCGATTPVPARPGPAGEPGWRRWAQPASAPIRLADRPVVAEGAAPAAPVAATFAGDTFRRETEGDVTRFVGPDLDKPVPDAGVVRVTLVPGGASRLFVVPRMTGEDAARSRRDRGFEVPLARGDTGEVVVEADLGGIAGFHDAARRPRLEGLTFDLHGAGGDAAVRHVEVLREDARYAKAPAGTGWLERDGVLHPGVFVNDGAVARVATRVPDGASLRWRVAATGKAARVEVRLIDGDAVTVLDDAPATAKWAARRADLAPFAGRDVTIELASRGGAALFGAPEIVNATRTEATPDVLVVLVDTLRADGVGALGNPAAGVTPRLDALAADGVLFSQARSSSPWTKPAIPSLMASSWPTTHRVGARRYTDKLPAGVPLVQERFRDAGWRTGSFTASPLGSTMSGLERGFDTVFPPEAWKGRLGRLRHPSSVQLAEALGAWVDEQPDQPFFAYVHTLEVHEYEKPVYDGTLPDGWARYDQAVNAGDEGVGAILDALEARGRRPLVVIVSDHGESFGDHGYRWHGTSLYESQTRIPLILSAPGALPPVTIDVPVTIEDVAPTLLELAGLPPLPDADGASLVPLIEGRPLDRAGVPAALLWYIWAPNAPKQFAWITAGRDKALRIDDRTAGYALPDDPCERDPVDRPDAEAALDAWLRAEQEAAAAFEARYGASEGAVDAADAERMRALGYIE